MDTPAFIPLILSGGAGTRLWPLSREATPKPFIVLPDGETLLGKTALRALGIPGAGPLVTVTNRDYYFATKDVYATLPAGGPNGATYLLEPFGRNTAGAAALGALSRQRAFRRGRSPAGVAGRPPDPPPGGLCACGVARGGSRTRTAGW